MISIDRILHGVDRSVVEDHLRIAGGGLGGQVPQGSFRRPGVRRVSAVSRLKPGGLRAELRNARNSDASCLKKAAAYFAREQK